MMADLLPCVIGFAVAGILIVLGRFAETLLARYVFRRGDGMVPADHGLASDRVLAMIDVLAEDVERSDEEIVAGLVERGIPEFDAELLVIFVPIAFSWILLRKMGISSFPGTFFVFDRRNRPVEMPLAREHYFALALALADEVVRDGFDGRIDPPTFEAILARSPYTDSIGQVMDAGRDPAGCKVRPPILLGLSPEAFAARSDA